MNERDLTQKVKAKVVRIIELYKEQKQENEQLKVLLNQHKEELDIKNKEIEELKKQLHNLDLANAFTSANDSKEAKQKINAIVREIDNCIALLNR